MQYYLFTLLGFGILAYWFNRHIRNSQHYTQTKYPYNKEEIELSDEDKEVLDKDQRKDMRETIKPRCIIIGTTALVLLVLITSMFNIVKTENNIDISAFLACSFISVFVTVLITAIKLLLSDVQLLRLSDIQKFELVNSDKNYTTFFSTLKSTMFTNLVLIGVLMGVVAFWPSYTSLFSYEHSTTVLFYLSLVAFLPSQFTFGNRISPNVQKICLSLSSFLFALLITCIPK